LLHFKIDLYILIRFSRPAAGRVERVTFTMRAEYPGTHATEWENIKKVVDRGNSFLITTHVQADPDALGSELALAEALRTSNKQTIILNPTPMSKHFRFLDSAREVQAFDEKTGLNGFALDAVFILDISRWERLGALADPIRHCGSPKICIDHHPYSGGFADHHLVNVNACASAEIVYDLIQYLNLPLSKSIAERLYASIVADTGSFSFSNTNARSHEIASHLLSFGVSSRATHENLHQNHTPERLRFLGQSLNNLHFDCDGRLAWMSISNQMLKENGLQQDDVEGFVDIPRNCREVLLSIVFLEVEPNDVKVSLRAKGNFNANKLASTFGGGGHNHASGIRILDSLDNAKKMVLEEARKTMASIT
jgi:bifunctional oligoribonuclease and PAP phosphatase NrnA